MTSVDTEHFRAALEDERQRVRHAIEYMHGENPRSDDDGTESHAHNHLAETASMTLDEEIDDTLEENSGHVLEEIDDALARIDAGTYGICAICGREIALERLEAIPYATQCIDCKRRAEGQ
ncbi:MAG TPA: TraR/DksA C4-type zinc finger protein [Gaiellaceae bacterium]